MTCELGFEDRKMEGNSIDVSVALTNLIHKALSYQLEIPVPLLFGRDINNRWEIDCAPLRLSDGRGPFYVSCDKCPYNKL